MRIELDSLTELDELMNITAEPNPNPGPNIKFNGSNGKYGKSASLWLAYMDRHRETGSTPSLYLQRIDDLLEGEAAQWVLDTPSVSALVCKGYVGLATECDVDAFRGALGERFKFATEEEEAREVSFATLADRLRKLKQGVDEGLEQYFGRAERLLVALRGRDGGNEALTPSEVSLRVVVVCGFVAGLSSNKLRHRLQQRICHHTMSLHQVFKMARAEMKMTKSKEKAKLRKMKERKRNDKQNRRSERKKHWLLAEQEQSKHNEPSLVATTKRHSNAVKNQAGKKKKKEKRKPTTTNEQHPDITRKQKRIAKRKLDAQYW